MSGREPFFVTIFLAGKLLGRGGGRWKMVKQQLLLGECHMAGKILLCYTLPGEGVVREV